MRIAFGTDEMLDAFVATEPDPDESPQIAKLS